MHTYNISQQKAQTESNQMVLIQCGSKLMEQILICGMFTVCVCLKLKFLFINNNLFMERAQQCYSCSYKN